MTRTDLIEMGEWVASLYSFLILGKGKMTGEQFANHISDAYTCEAYDPNLKNVSTAKNYEAWKFANCYITEIESTYKGVRYCLRIAKRITPSELISKFQDLENK